MGYRAVIFDFDGTLADSIPLCLASFHAALEPLLGREVSDAEIVATFGKTEEGTMQAILPPEKAEEGIQAYLRHYGEQHEALCPALFEGARELLADLRRRGVHLGLITGKGPHSVQVSLERLGIADMFEHVRSGSANGPVKDRQMVELVDLLGIEPAHTLYVGDSLYDIEASRAAGVDIASAGWAKDARIAALEAAHPLAVFRDFPSFAKWLWTKVD